MFGKTVLDIDGELFADAMDALKRDRGVTDDVDLTADDLEELVETFKKIVQAADRAGRSRSTRASSWTWR